MRNRAYASHIPVHVGKSENLSKSSLLVIVQVICIYAAHFPAPKEGEPEAWQFPFLNIKEEKQTETVLPTHRHPQRYCSCLCWAAEEGFNLKTSIFKKN